MAQSTTSDTHGAVDDVPTGRVSARTCAAEWTRLWTVKATWWFLVAATVVLVGLGIALGFEAAADPVRLQGEPAWQTAQYIAMPAQFALLAFALTAVTSDYATGRIVPTLQWTPRRTVLFLAPHDRDDRSRHRPRCARGLTTWVVGRRSSSR
jgi:ABC-2 type transport system permease protein